MIAATRINWSKLHRISKNSNHYIPDLSHVGSIITSDLQKLDKLRDLIKNDASIKQQIYIKIRITGWGEPNGGFIVYCMNASDAIRYKLSLNLDDFQ